jgi:hypothetical protein
MMYYPFLYSSIHKLPLLSQTGKWCPFKWPWQQQGWQWHNDGNNNDNNGSSDDYMEVWIALAWIRKKNTDKNPESALKYHTLSYLHLETRFGQLLHALQNSF